ncbi:MAG: hypothetical protein IT260_12230 [Saprospiraceae bacterium]|nr:hypothetical protein [Saprospiraceae bacterium]
MLHRLFPIQRPLFLLSAVALLAHLALCPVLWGLSPGRTFPLLPLLELPFPSGDAWMAAQAWLSIGWLLAAVFFSGQRALRTGLLLWLLWMVAQDLNRLQPWLYFYLLVQGVLWFDRSQNESSSGGLVRVLLAAVYAWGGFNKLTPYFAEDNFPWFCTAFSWTQALGPLVWAGYAVALAELAFAPGILWPKSRALFRWAVLGFHLFIALALTPWGLNWNQVVIPWNLAMAGMVWVLSRPQDQEEPSLKVLFAQNNWPTQVALGGILALAWLLPTLNIAHRWDEALSWKMYSNTQTEATVYRSGESSCPAVAPVWEQWAYAEGRRLLLDDWAFAELKVPAYNSPAAFRRIARYLCRCSSPADASGLELLSVERWNKQAEKTEQIPCSALLSPTN